MNSMDLTQRDFTDSEFKKVTLPQGQVMQAIDYSGCSFTRCLFREVSFLDCKFLNCTFKDCDLNLAKLTGCTFAETRFEDSKLMGVDWTVTAWGRAKLVALKPADFYGCLLNYNVFMGMNLRKVALSTCTALDAGFEDANLTEADCRGTDFSGSRFTRADLTKADLRGARNYAISPLTSKIKGAKFTLPEALSLLNGLDISLEDS